MIYTIEFDASAEGVPPGVQIDALSQNTAGNLVVSFNTTVELSGATFQDEDLVEVDGANFTSFFDGSAEGVDAVLDVDGAHVFPGSDFLALSFDISGTVGGIYFDDEDVLEFDPGSGTWEMAWDTSVERPEWPSGSDVDAVHLVPEPGALAMLTAGSGLLAWLYRRHELRRDSRSVGRDRKEHQADDETVDRYQRGR